MPLKEGTHSSGMLCALGSLSAPSTPHAWVLGDIGWVGGRKAAAAHRHIVGSCMLLLQSVATSTPSTTCLEGAYASSMLCALNLLTTLPGVGVGSSCPTSI